MRMTIQIRPEALRGLLAVAEHEYREPRQMAGFLVEEALINRGLLAAEDSIYIPPAPPLDYIQKGVTIVQ